jgi:high-affinity K+ transport system ATPase subunit B
MPLVYLPGSERGAASERQRKARKIKPQYAEGRLVKVARAGGFDVPDFLAAGPRDVLVPESGAEAAREALAPQTLASDERS